MIEMQKESSNNGKRSRCSSLRSAQMDIRDSQSSNAGVDVYQALTTWGALATQAGAVVYLGAQRRGIQMLQAHRDTQDDGNFVHASQRVYLAGLLGKMRNWRISS